MIGEPRQDALPGLPRLDPRGLVRCPWECGRTLRLTKNNNARTIYVEPHPNNLGRIVAYCDDRDVWHSRQLKAGETRLAYETQFLIHSQRLCPHWRRSQGLPPAPRPRPVIVPPPPGPMPSTLAADTRAALEKIRQARRDGSR